MSRLNRFWFVAFTTVAIGLLGSMACSVAESKLASAGESSADTVKAAQQGPWALFWIPKPWVEANFSKQQVSKAYVAVYPPAHEDINEYWPCYAPPRLVTALYDEEGYSELRLHSCFDYCGTEDNTGNMHKDLWGPDSQLSDVALTHNATELVLTETYTNRRDAAAIPASKLEEKRWTTTISAAELTTAESSLSCLDL